MSARVRRSWSEGRAGTAARSPGPTRDKELESGSYGRERRRACRETRSGARSSSVGESPFQSELPSRQAVTLPVGNSCSGHEALRREGAEAHRAWAAAGRRTRVLPLAAKKKKKSSRGNRGARLASCAGAWVRRGFNHSPAGYGSRLRCPRSILRPSAGSIRRRLSAPLPSCSAAARHARTAHPTHSPLLGSALGPPGRPPQPSSPDPRGPAPAHRKLCCPSYPSPQPPRTSW